MLFHIQKLQNVGVKTTSFGIDNIGRLTYNVDMEDVEYNYLNLPNKITLNNGDIINYTYGASGILWKKENIYSKVGLDPKNRHYLNGVIYNNKKLESIQTDEGRYALIQVGEDEPAWVYEYVINDHLGNGRVWFADLNNDGVISRTDMNDEVTLEQDYYPFGMSMNKPSNFDDIQPTNEFRYNSKELEEGLGWYNYGARFYDPAIGRFMSVDPLSELYPSTNSYVYTLNNPIIFIDPDGRYVSTNDGYNELKKDMYENDSEFYVGDNGQLNKNQNPLGSSQNNPIIMNLGTTIHTGGNVENQILNESTKQRIDAFMTVNEIDGEIKMLRVAFPIKQRRMSGMSENDYEDYSQRTKIKYLLNERRISQTVLLKIFEKDLRKNNRNLFKEPNEGSSQAELIEDYILKNYNQKVNKSISTGTNFILSIDKYNKA